MYVWVSVSEWEYVELGAYLPSCWRPECNGVDDGRDDKHGEGHEEGPDEGVEWAEEREHEGEQP